MQRAQMTTENETENVEIFVPSDLEVKITTLEERVFLEEPHQWPATDEETRPERPPPTHPMFVGPQE